jgi:hypothetical protein
MDAKNAARAFTEDLLRSNRRAGARIDAIAREAIDHFGKEPFLRMARLWDDRLSSLIVLSEAEKAQLADHEEGPTVYSVAAFPVAHAFVRDWLARSGRDVDTTDVLVAAIRLARS